MAHGLEARVPFLDKDMLDVTMFTSPEYKMIRKGEETQYIEKWLLRAAFDTPDAPYLPSEVLWRQKEQFSDGVGCNGRALSNQEVGGGRWEGCGR